jgi:polyphosphate kinase
MIKQHVLKSEKIIPRDISWLAFNSRVLQEAADENVPIKERIKFLGIFSNNLDEFFRVRVAALKKMVLLGTKAKMHLELNPQKILTQIQTIVLAQQKKFELVWNDIIKTLKEENIFFVDDKKLTAAQKQFVTNYFNEEVRTSVVPLMLESLNHFPTLSDKSIYLACKLTKTDGSLPQKFALVSIPVRNVPRFILLPKQAKKQFIILLEDVIRYNLPSLFSFFNYDTFSAHIIKVTRDAEIDIDNDVPGSLIQKLEKGIKNRKKGKPVRFVYDKNIDPVLFTLLIKKLQLSGKGNLIAGGRIHNYKDFINFPTQIFSKKSVRNKPFTHPLLNKTNNISSIISKQDVMLHFPYHSFDSVINLLREAAIDPAVQSIKITCYRLATKSKIIHALTNAVRNGKKVTVMLELRARFDEEANLEWKEKLEEAGVKVLLGVPNFKVHAKICLIKKVVKKVSSYYGFVSTGNLNGKTAEVYGDHCLLTANKQIMADISRVFTYLENYTTKADILKKCKTLLVSPTNMRRQINVLINKEIKFAQQKKHAAITLKINSLSDKQLIAKLYEATNAGVEIKLIVRGICCMLTQNKKFKKPVKAISIVDEYLEHARIMIFNNNGNEKVFISSADWMQRNIDHRVEVACPILDKTNKKQLKDILNIQLADNTKARVLDNRLRNDYVVNTTTKKVRSQVEIYNYLYKAST